MITTLIGLLIVALVLWLVYWGVGKFMSGTPYQIVGVILGLVFLLYALRSLGILNLGI